MHALKEEMARDEEEFHEMMFSAKQNPLTREAFYAKIIGEQIRGSDDAKTNAELEGLGSEVGYESEETLQRRRLDRSKT